MNFRIFFPSLVASLIQCGCASDDNAWVRDGTPRSEVEQALAECKYQPQAAAIGIGSNTTPGTWSDAISEGIGSGIVQAMDEEELIKSCMRAKGFRQ